MSEPGPTTGLLSLVMELAGRGLGQIDVLKDAVGKLRPEMFSGEERLIFEGARTLLDHGDMPSGFAIACKVGLSPLGVGRIKTSGAHLYGNLAAALTGVLTQHAQMELTQGLSSALRAAQAGQLEHAQALL